MEGALSRPQPTKLCFPWEVTGQTLHGTELYAFHLTWNQKAINPVDNNNDIELVMDKHMEHVLKVKGTMVQMARFPTESKTGIGTAPKRSGFRFHNGQKFWSNTQVGKVIVLRILNALNPTGVVPSSNRNDPFLDCDSNPLRKVMANTA